MPFRFPAPLAVQAFRARTSLLHSRQRAIAVLILTLVSATGARADAAVESKFRRDSVVEGDPSQQVINEIAGAAAPPPRFGTACSQVVQSSTIPAVLSGPVAGPLPAPLSRCDAVADASPAHTPGSGRVPELAMMLRELPWQMGDHGTAAARIFAPSHVLASADLGLREEIGEATPEPLPTSTSTEDCSQIAGCETRANAPANVPHTASLAPPATGQTTERSSGRMLRGFLWLTLLVFVAALVFAVGWVVRSWFRYDRLVVRAARAGLRRGEFHVEYQPVVGVRRARCVGVEALLRWDNPKYGALGPGHYMPVIESSSLIGPLTRFVMSRAAQELREIGAPKSLYLGVSAPSSYLLSSGFIADLEYVGSSGLPPLIFKIDVGSTRKFSKRLIPMMKLARQKQVRFALSGVRPADRAFELPRDMSFEMVKVDRQVLGLDPDERASHLNALTGMGHDIGAVVVIEGVENMAHHNIARSSRAEFGQGFFYSRALGAIRLKDFLETTNAPHSSTGGTATVLGWRVRNY
ncbi:EAL domain-containing protein [Paraburkholderia terrae]